ncbi:hypothetical protein [Pseudonocardia spinosispora]|uniref:hypothetical protein n=1 Tax=Pseudonocardia spinosispora TaxID=103441 RepID=UPI0004258202|nr:hypothetical protein [Pseudonocardia spinosispora]
MPQFFIDAPIGLDPDTKQTMMEEITQAIDAAYHIPDVRIWLREHNPANVAQDGRIQAEPVRPVCFLEAPELDSVDARRDLSAKIHAAIGTAYKGLANTDETLILMNFYPLESAGFAGRMQSDNPDFVAALSQLNA